jgi:anti-sigma-K factor RskA
MSVHEQFAEDLALYALGALTGEERKALEAHLATCPSCKLELEQFRGDGALLALSTVGAKPPARSRQRLLDAVAKEPRAVRIPEPRRSWWGVLGWAAAVAVIVFAASLWVDNQVLHEQINAQRRQLYASQAELTSARDVVTTLTATDAMHVTLIAAKTPPQPQGKAFYLRNKGTLVFMANNLAPLPPQKAYELWLIPAQGAPIPAGVFKPDAHGSATVVNPPLPAGTEAKAFAITIENEAGATSPTMPIVMMGTGE